jgi:hypothetical protein
MAAGENKPRWQPGAKPASAEREVELPDLEATVLLRKPSVTAMIEAQKQITKDSDEFDDSLRLVAITLVEPALSYEQLRAEVPEWTTEDWLTLQAAALDLIGFEKLGQIQARFRQG